MAQAYDITGFSDGQRHSASMPEVFIPHDVAILASDLTFIDVSAHGLAYPQRGDVVNVGGIVGVVENSTESTSDYALIKLYGRYVVPAVGLNETPANTAINVGDVVYFDPAIPEINVDGVNGVRAGIAVGPGDGEVLAGGASGSILVQFNLGA